MKRKPKSLSKLKRRLIKAISDPKVEVSEYTIEHMTQNMIFSGAPEYKVYDTGISYLNITLHRKAKFLN